MKVLLTGASSFTGLWFAQALVAKGATVVTPLRGSTESYEGERKRRVAALSKVADVRFETSFGGAAFSDLVTNETFDVFCHHAATVENYRSADFDVTSALASNTAGFKQLAETLKARGTRSVVLTGSVFEPNAGAGTFPLKAFSPYGLSKALSSQVIAYHCDKADLPISKFVIANPFGPFEEPRFCAYLIKTWKSGQTAEVKTPLYVRDNIHVSLLAKTYAAFVTEAAAGTAAQLYAPTGYVETQGSFARRFAGEIGPRLGLDCPLALAQQTDFSEPLVRINTDVINLTALGWLEGAAWDELASYYA